MKVRWLGVVFVAVLVAGTLVLKSRTSRQLVPSASNQSPAVILVADFREAEENDDPCAVIIRAARQASARGVRVTELPPDSTSDLLRQHHIVIVPTVLVLDRNGSELSRFEGEREATVKAVQTRLADLSGSTQ